MTLLKIMMKFTSLAFVAFLCWIDTALAQHKSREIVPFNQDWVFMLSDDLAFRHSDYPTEDWQRVRLPHDWSIGFDFDASYPAGNAGGALPGGIGWYRKDFVLDQNDENKRIFIQFGGIYRYSEIWINGHYLGKHSNGYLSFEKELTKYVNYGGEKNTLAIRADNSLQPNSRWYSGSGIYRDVVMEKRHPIYLDRSETYWITPTVSAGESVVAVRTALNTELVGEGWKLNASLHKGSQQVARIERPLPDANATTDISVKDVELWSPEAPNLYALQLQLISPSGEVVDDISYNVGFRTIEFDADKGFFLNGKAYKILGVCLHHDLGILGAAFNKSAAKRQLLLMKDMGVNAIRTAHNPPAEQFLDLCDELGFLVYDEAYDMWKKRKNKFDYSIDFEEFHLSDLERFVKRDRNHTSVFMWSIGNEIREQFDSTGATLTKSMANVVRGIDSTRYITAALTETDRTKNFIAQADALDVLGFNYKYFDYDKLPVEFPGVPLIASETTSALATRGVYDLLQDTVQLWPASAKDKYVVGGNDDFTVSAYDNVAAYWGTSHERAWLEVKNRDFLGGIFVWTGFDYLGEPVPYPYPARSSYYGIVDLAGLPKDVYYMYQSEWTDKDVFHLLPHWNWQPGDVVDVWSYYSHADSVELFLNDKSLGFSSKTSDRLHASWKVAFEPGELKAVKYKGGNPSGEVAVRTAEAVSDIVVHIEHDRYATGSEEDLYFVEINLTAQDGSVVPNDDIVVSVKAMHNAEILGTDNGYQADTSGLTNSSRVTFKGKMVAFVRKVGSKDSAAEIEVSYGGRSKVIAIK